MVPMLVEPAEHPLLDEREVDDAADRVHRPAPADRLDLDVGPVVVAVQVGALALVPKQPMPRAEPQGADQGEPGRRGGGHHSCVGLGASP